MPRYQVHFEPGEGSDILMRLEIADAVLAARLEEARSLEKEIVRDLPARWKLSSTASLQTALERGLIAGFTVAIVPELSERRAKTARFINHVR